MSKIGMRIGHGFDVHRFAEGRRLVLGGVYVPFERGMEAHSDGDVLLHALCDALLGAAGLGDIGQHFPDTNDDYQDIDSRILLRHVFARLSEQQFSVVNVDATLIAQVPKLSPFLTEMKNNIACDLNITATDVNIKATTTEKLGYIGREEGIASHAVVLLAG